MTILSAVFLSLWWFFCQLVALTSAFVMNHGFPKNLAPQRKNNLRLDAVVKR